MRFGINIYCSQAFMMMMTTQMGMKSWTVTTSLHGPLGRLGEAIIGLTLEKGCGDGSVFYRGHTRGKTNA